jgi:acetate kinase
VYLLEQKGLSVAQLSDILNRRSGLTGVSGGSPDMRDLLAREAADPHAAEAIELFCYQARKFLGALAAALGGLDALIFTAGIGENAPEVRRRICEGMGHLGLALDLPANDANAPLISSNEARVSVRVIPTNEELMIARHTASVIRKTSR